MYGLLTWLPTFFTDFFGVELAGLGGYRLLPCVLRVGPEKLVKLVFRFLVLVYRFKCGDWLFLVVT
jgi:hypothetical protein